MIENTRLIREAAGLGVTVSPQQAELLDRYCTRVAETNRQLNLTAITDPREMEIKHLLDCLTVCAIQELQGKVADVGTGAGFPGVVLKIMRPDLDVTLIDATRKKLDFVQRACDDLGVAVTTVHGRAEELARGVYRESFDTVTARAVAPMASLLEYTLPLVLPGGFLVAMKGPEAKAELADSAFALKELGGKVTRTVDVELPDNSGRRIVLVEKSGATPGQYPRGGKNISKKPLMSK